MGDGEWGVRRDALLLLARNLPPAGVRVKLQVRGLGESATLQCPMSQTLNQHTLCNPSGTDYIYSAGYAIPNLVLT